MVLQSDSLLTITEIAKDYGLSAKKLNLLLHDAGVQFNTAPYPPFIIDLQVQPVRALLRLENLARGQ